MRYASLSLGDASTMAVDLRGTSAIEANDTNRTQMNKNTLRGICLVGVAAVVGALLAFGQPASAGHQQDRVVTAVPAALTPQVQNGRVLTFAQVGTTMVAGGNFSTIKQGPTTSSRTNIVAFNATTGAVNNAFNPQLNGVVNSLLPGPTAGTVYVGGAFSTLNGNAVPRVILLNVSDGSRVNSFNPPAIANGVVNDLERVGNRLYIGGTFTKVKALAHAGIASLDATTGLLDPYVNLQFSGHHNWAGSGAKAGVGVGKMAVSPNGRWLAAIGNFTDIRNSPTGATFHRDQAAMIDLGGASAEVREDWNTDRYVPRCFDWAFDTYMRDIDFAPSGDYFAIVATGGPNPGTLCDTVTRWETTDTGQAVQPTWINDTGGDTLFSVAVTGTAVYVGGHQRWMNNAGGLDSPAPGAVPRAGLGAVDPVSGVPLEWNPGRNPRGVGAFALLATDAGLWVGSDTNYIGNKEYFRPRIAFFPLAGGEALPRGSPRRFRAMSISEAACPARTLTSCTGSTPVAGPSDRWTTDPTGRVTGARTSTPATRRAGTRCPTSTAAWTRRRPPARSSTRSGGTPATAKRCSGRCRSRRART